MPPNNPVTTYDFTCHNMNDMTVDERAEDIKKILKQHCKKWGFQYEKGEKTGKFHFQGRFSLLKKARILNIPFNLGHYSITSNPNKKADSFYSYVTKDYTRESGPWTDKDQEIYIPRQYRKILNNLYPYQKVIYDSPKHFDDRVVNIIYCPNGNIGKSTIASICDLYGKGIDLPPVNNAEKLIQSCCDICIAKNIRDPGPIFVDIPRAYDQTKLYGLFTAIEQIKKGKLYDMRHSYREWWIDSPPIWVTMNVISPKLLEMLSSDRWKIWKVNHKKELIPYSISNPDDPDPVEHLQWVDSDNEE